jgi:hypothetical protein
MVAKYDAEETPDPALVLWFDESGHTGEDLINADQPIFVLASSSVSRGCRATGSPASSATSGFSRGSSGSPTTSSVATPWTTCATRFYGISFPWRGQITQIRYMRHNLIIPATSAEHRRWVQVPG